MGASAVKEPAGQSSDMFVPSYQTARYHIPHDLTVNNVPIKISGTQCFDCVLLLLLIFIITIISSSVSTSSLSAVQSESELRCDWRFTADQFVLATSPLRLTTSNFFN
jgi:hypothetical protein